MNELDKNKKLETLLEETAEQLQPNVMFKAELEEKLRKAHKPRTAFRFPHFNRLASALTGAAVLAALVFFTLWIFQSIEPQNNFGNEGFACPVTEPNGSLPPGETVESPEYLGNGELWTVLWPDGKVIMEPHNIEADGSFSMKWGFYRGVTGALTVEGRRLDADAEPLRAEIPEGYGYTGFQVAGLIFPTTGCWEVTAHVGESSLTFVTEVIYSEKTTPTSGVIIDPNATPSDESTGGYDFRGGKLFLSKPLPESPASASIFALQNYPPATIEQVRALAEQFGIQGEIYTAPGRLPDTTDYVVTDGKQFLSVKNAGSYYYTANMIKNTQGVVGKDIENAEATIQEFLSSHGFGFEYNIAKDAYGNYLIHPLAEDGLPIQYEFLTEPILRVVLDDEGNVLRLDANLAMYDPNPLGSFAIISAEEALQAVISGSAVTGIQESMYSMSGEPPQEWRREYADGEKVTIYGALSILPAVDTTQPTLFFIDGIPAIGNTNGLETVGNYVLVRADGQFVTENGFRKFIVDVWSRDVNLSFYSGTLRNEGGQIIFALDDGSGAEYPLIDPPADVPLNAPSPESQLLVNGIVIDGKFDWTIIQYFADSSQMGGGGGGGGMGFFDLNLSGTPIPFPTPGASLPPVNMDTSNALTYVVQEGDTLSQIASMYGLTPEQLMQANGLNEANIFIGQALVIPGTTAPPQLDGTRGMLNITIFVSDDGSERIQYAFLTNDPQNPYLLLEGDGLEELLSHNNKPVKIWGSADRLSEYGVPMITVERFEILFPELQFQLMFGSEESVQIEGREVILLTTENGENYVEFGSNCDVLGAENMSSKQEGIELMQLEVLAVPDLSFGGYPAVCVFATGIASDRNENTYGMEMTAAQPQRIPEPVFGTSEQPNLTIDSVELVYYASSSNYMLYDPTVTERYPYMQPAWRIIGTYDTGDKVEIAVQALRTEFLSPNPVP